MNLIRNPRIYSFLLLMALSANAFAFPAKFSVSPDSSQDSFMTGIGSAQKSILLNAYMITSFRLENLLIARMKAGVVVKVLIDTEPFGEEIVPPQKKVLDELDAAMKASGNPENKLYMLTSKNHTVKRRYVFDHGKYAVVDGQSSYISSENFVGSGVMADVGKKGNRGWQVWLQDTGTAKTLTGLFLQDILPGAGDVIPYDPQFVKVMTSSLPPRSEDNRRTLPPVAAKAGEVVAARICASPNSIACMADFIRTAKSSLEIQHLSLPLYWPSANRQKVINPIVQEITDAAKRGAKVRILIEKSKGDDSGDGSTGAGIPAIDSQETINYLRSFALTNHVSIQAFEINNKAIETYLLHNKGMIADQKRAWVGSINGTENSVNNNREVAVAMDSEDAAKYYLAVFDFDWAKSLTP